MCIRDRSRTLCIVAVALSSVSSPTCNALAAVKVASANESSVNCVLLNSLLSVDFFIF